MFAHFNKSLNTFPFSQQNIKKCGEEWCETTISPEVFRHVLTPVYCESRTLLSLTLMWKLLAVCLSTSFRLHCGCLGGVTLQWHSTSASGLILTVTRQFITPGSTQEACTDTQTRRALTWNDRCKAVLILYLTDKMSRWNTRCAFVYWWLLRGAGHLLHPLLTQHSRKKTAATSQLLKW